MMKTLMRRRAIIAGLALVGILLPFAALADGSIWPTGYWGPILTCRGTACNLCELAHTLQHLINVMLSIAIFAVAPVLIIYAGFRIMTAGANPEGISAGKSVLTGTVVGIALALGAFLIVQFVVNILADVNPSVKSTLKWPNFSCNL